MGKGSGTCSRPAINIFGGISEPSSLFQLQKTSEEQYLFFEDSLLENNSLFVHFDADAKQWHIWGKLKRGGVEQTLIQSLKKEEACLQKYFGYSKTSYRNGNVPSSLALVQKKDKLKFSYTPHGGLGQQLKKIWFWKIEVGNHRIDYQPPTYSLEELRISKDAVWRLPDMHKKAAAKLEKMSIPSAEEISNHKDWAIWKDGKFVQKRHFKEYTLVQSLNKDLHDFVVKWNGGKDDSESRLQQALLAHFGKKPSWTLQKSIQDWLKKTKVEKISKKVWTKVPNSTLFSHRGQFTAKADSIEEALEFLQSKAILNIQKGHVTDVDPRIEKHAFYTKNPTKVPSLKSKQKIWHTICKVEDLATAQKRLDSIFTKGLLSTFERERQGIKVDSLDPGGDKAQNIDWGVPCHIGAKPSYADHGKIHLCMKPSLLQRKSLFFAAKTEWSWQSYLQYNASLEHTKFWQDCPPNATKKHLDALGKSNYPYNEMWAGWKITPEEIGYVVVTNPDWVKPLQKAFPHIPIKSKWS